MSQSDPETRVEQQRAAGLVHVLLKDHLGVSGVHVVVMIVVMLVTLFGIIAVIASRVLPIAPAIATVALILLVPIGLIGLVTRAARRAASAQLGPTDDGRLELAVREALPRIRGFGAGDGLKALVATLSQRGHGGLVLRLGGAAEDKLDPFEMPFEPQPLDETASPLIQEHIRDAGGKEARQVDDSAAARKLRRNIILRGGWFVVLAFGFNWVMRVFEAIRERRITPDLVLWTIFMALLLIVPPTAQRRKQWYLVPGGLAIRDRTLFGRTATVRLLPRTTSVLCVALVGTRQWRAVATDGAETVSSVLTPGEAAALIRAWLSPLPPPSVEQLSDLQ